MANPVTTAERQVTHAGETPLSAKELELMHALAGMQFPLGRNDLSERQPVAEGTAEDRARQAPAARPLG